MFVIIEQGQVTTLINLAAVTRIETTEADADGISVCFHMLNAPGLVSGTRDSHRFRITQDQWTRLSAEIYEFGRTNRV